MTPDSMISPPSKRHLILATLAGVGALATGIMTAKLKNEKNESTEDDLSALWALTLQSPAGTPLPLSQFKGKPLLINFWATWCAPCIEEMPMLNEFHLKNQASGNGLQLLGIAADKAESVVKFLEKMPVQFPIAISGFDGIELSRSLGNTRGGLPFTVLVSKNDGVLFKKEGQLTTNELKIIEKLI